jgi:hypothetical protein
MRWIIATGRAELPRFVNALIGLQIIAISSGAFTALKASIPTISPFWLDVNLAQAEVVFGFAPWQVSHAALGWATPAIDLLYWSWFTVQPVALYTILLSKPSPRKSRALVTFALTTLIIGVFAAYVFSSAGPIFYDRIYGGHTFAALTAVLSQQAPKMMFAQDLLWQAYTTHTTRLGNGISAMPSFHVALCTWLMLVTRDTRFSLPSRIYFVLIWIGSIHLGWHYFSDGLVASIGVLLLWKAAPLVMATRFAPRKMSTLARST